MHQVQFDVVVAAFSLSELPSKADRTDVVQTLWRKTGHFLVLIENGTKAGHSLLMDARDLVLNGKEKSPLDPRPGFVFAPCPHELPCPQLTASKPLACSFSQAYHPIPFSWNKKPKDPADTRHKSVSWSGSWRPFYECHILPVPAGGQQLEGPCPHSLLLNARRNECH